MQGNVLFDLDGPGADYEQLHVLQDRESGLRAVVAVHSTRLGPAFGGIRRRAYPDEASALDDVVRLAESMSMKCALAGLPAGGAKTVILDHPGLDVAAAYRAVGRLVDQFDGRYVCGPDLGTSEADLDEVRKQTRYVNPRGNDPGRSTAASVLAGIRGVLDFMEGEPSFSEHTFLVQGLGSVGGHVARELLEAGATVLGTDTDEGALQAARAAGVVPIPPDAALSTSCDVFVPCAIGGVIREENVRTLRARAVCGSANNQLATLEAGARLHEAGILFAPDILVNSGAVTEGFYTIRDGAKEGVRRKAAKQIDQIEETVPQILERSQSEDVPSAVVAVAMAKERIAAGP